MDIQPAVALRGAAELPGDKSISHRALLVGAVTEGEVAIHGFGRSLDTETTLDAVRALGVAVDEADETLVVRGVGLRGLREPGAPIDCGNAGTLARLLPGLLAGQAGSDLHADGGCLALLAADGADRGAARGDGRRGDDDGWPTAPDGRGRRTGRHRAHAGSRERAGQVVRALRGALRLGQDDGHRADRDARPHRAAAARRGRARRDGGATALRSIRPTACAWSGSTCPGTSRPPRL